MTHPFESHAIGPNLCKFLGIKGGPQGFDEARAQEFQAYLHQRFADQLPDQEAFEAILTELTQMKLSAAAVGLAESATQAGLSHSFKSLLAFGGALMLEQEFDAAREVLQSAQSIAPDEPAPYLNLAELEYAAYEDLEALEWAKRGLKKSKNERRLWEIVASIWISEFGSEETGQRLKSLSSELGAYAGYSLAAEVLAPGDALLKAEYLTEAYEQDVRDPEFLIEYTAILGLARAFDKVPPVLLEYEMRFSEKAPWQLRAHTIQAHLAAGATELAQELIDKERNHVDFPKDALQTLQTEFEQTKEEFEENQRQERIIFTGGSHEAHPDQ